MPEYSVGSAHRDCIVASAKAQRDAGEVGNLEKIAIPVPPEAGWETSAEWVWAEPIAPNVFSIKNIPIYAYGFAMHDHVWTEEKAGASEVVRVVRRNGHSNYRIMTEQPIQDGPAGDVLNALMKVGCDWEQGNAIHASIDVPPTSDIHKVFELLRNAETDGILKFEEGFCAHPLC